MAVSKLSDPPKALAVPRGWLTLITVLLVVPWLVAGAIYFRGAGGDGVEAESVAAASPPASAPSGPWGEITATRIVIAPPIEYVSTDWGNWVDQPDRWFFPGVTQEQIGGFLVSTGLSQGDVAALMASARPIQGRPGFVLTPDPGLVQRLNRDVRGRLYAQLGRTGMNVSQANAFRFHGNAPADWLNGSLIAPATRQAVEPLVYRAGNFLYFADVRTVRGVVADATERQRLGKALLRQSTVLLSLSLRSRDDVERVAAYWGMGGRRTDIRPLLESLADDPAKARIDIVHLLPTFARQYLYRYPKLSTADLTKPALANCLWSALNFFNTTPEDRFLDLNVALDTLRTDYYIVENSYQLGDVIGFVDRDGDLYHAAVYLAGDYVFTKNGTSSVSPWTVMTVDELKDYYQSIETEPRLIYHRKRTL